MLNELSCRNLKLKIKQWEKNFVSKNGHKPSKSDIDSDPSNIRQYYKDYWNIIKANRKSSSNTINLCNQKENKVSFETWSKDLNKSSKNLEKEVKVTKTQNSLSHKLFRHFMKENSFTKSSYSLKKKFKPSKLFQINEEKLLKDENQVSNSSKGNSLNVLADQTNLCHHSFTNHEQKNEEFKNCNPIIFGSSLPSFNSDHVQQINNSDLKNNDIHIIVDNIIDSLDTNNCLLINSNSFEYCFSDHDSAWPFNVDASSQSQQMHLSPKPFNEEASSLFSSLIRESIFSNDTDGPLEDFCIFENDSKSQKRKLENVPPASFYETKKVKTDPVDIYEFVPEDDETKIIKKKKVTFNIKPKKKIKKKLKIPEANYRKIDLNKKVFRSRGFKKFNARRFKQKAWKKMQKDNANQCFKCGQKGHWADHCSANVDFNEDFGEEEKLKSNFYNSNLSCIRSSVEPILLSENADYSQLMQEGLEELGFKEFKGKQKYTIERILKTESILHISSTGSGKSLCYQIPAYLFGKYKKYITLVISPLISLMEDQLNTLPKKLKGVCLHSNMKNKQKEFNISLLQNGQAQVLFMSPESIVNGNNLGNLLQLPTIAFVCIDEAHCLSEWSNNFRPSYLQLCQMLKTKLKVRTFLALTATATQKICNQICRNLNISSQDIIGNTQVPENLILTVSHDTNKDQALIDLLQSPRFVNLDSIIIYCTRRETTDRLAALIRILMQGVKTNSSKLSSNGLAWDAQSYHAGLSSEQRLKIQKRFSKNDLRVVVATIAFGMGINKSNVGGIVHYNMPRNFESYVQEIGRAGRDNSLAYCHLFLDCDGSDLFEIQRHIYANTTDRHYLRKLIEKIFKKCKCSMLEENSETNFEKNSICLGHELAFPINDITMELDMKVENILTLISFIELNFPESKLRLLPSVESTCKLHFYSSDSNKITQIASKCSPVALALATLHRKTKNEVPSSLEFNYVEIATMLGRDSSHVRKELNELEWCQDSNGKWKKSGVKIEFSNPSIRVKSPGNLSNNELDSILFFIDKYNQSLEWVEINKLKYVYSTFRQVSQAKCTNKFNLVKSNKLKETLNHYFNNSLNKELELESWLSSNSEMDLNHSNENEDKKAEILSVCNIEQARKDVRDIISIYKEGHDLTARAIARILQGISSPRFPAETWGKVKRFWRSNINIDFNELIKFANEELLRLKNLE